MLHIDQIEAFALTCVYILAHLPPLLPHKLCCYSENMKALLSQQRSSVQYSIIKGTTQ